MLLRCHNACVKLVSVAPRDHTARYGMKINLSMNSDLLLVRTGFKICDFAYTGLMQKFAQVTSLVESIGCSNVICFT